MFAFHETTRKRICRTAFFALCVAPTFATFAWIGGHYFPGRKGRVSRELGDVLDVHIKLADWREPRPLVIRSSGLTLSDPASGYALADVAQFELRRGGGVQAYSANEVVVEGAQLEPLGERVLKWIAKLPPESHEIHCSTLTVKLIGDAGNAEAQHDELVLHDVRGRVDRDAAGRVRVQLVARAAGDNQAGAAIRLTLEPSADDGSAAPTLTLDAQAASIPARLLAGIVPGFGRFGADARFVGVVRLSLDQRQTHGMVQGRVDAVDLTRILPAGSPHALRGAADIELSELSWRGDRIEQLAGAVSAEQARVSRSLIDAMVKNFSCGQNGDGVSAADDAAMIALDVLAFQFELNGNGLTFWGHCPPEMNLGENCIAASGMQPLLFGPPFRDWPLGMLVQTLAAPSVAWLPATREAIDMAGRLPLPLR